MSKEVILYTRPVCPICNYVKEYLLDNSIDYVEYDISKDEEALANMLKRTRHEMVPAIVKGDSYIIGFDEEKMKEILL